MHGRRPHVVVGQTAVNTAVLLRHVVQRQSSALQQRIIVFSCGTPSGFILTHHVSELAVRKYVRVDSNPGDVGTRVARRVAGQGQGLVLVHCDCVGRARHDDGGRH